jgi:hypothetical protein
MTSRGVVLAGLLVAGLLAMAAPAAAQGEAAPNTLTPAEKAEGWRLLFDGRTTDGWRGYRKQEMTDGWQVVDGALTRVGRGGDIITVDQFQDFDLAFEWKVAPGGNSGVFFRASEETGAVWQNAAEYQILDNAGHKDGQDPLTSTGSNYAMHAPTKDVSRPAGEWNSSRIVVKGNHVEHWLNGEKIVEYEIGSEEWLALYNKSKFNKYPTYGRVPRGHIAIQDHGDHVAFRSIKIRPLDK